MTHMFMFVGIWRSKVGFALAQANIITIHQTHSTMEFNLKLEESKNCA